MDLLKLKISFKCVFVCTGQILIRDILFLCTLIEMFWCINLLISNFKCFHCLKKQEQSASAEPENSLNATHELSPWNQKDFWVHVSSYDMFL